MNKLEVITLDNGLKVYLYKEPKRHSTFFQFITLFGGITKDFKYKNREYHFQDGIAHILEHYIVECNDCGNFLKELGKRQMNTNAFTHFNMTRFYFEAVEDVNYGIRTMLEGIYNIKFEKEKLEKLKNPIYQEIRGRSDNKFYQASILTLDNLFNKINFRSIGGEIEEVKKTTIEDIKTCYEAFYQPKNQFIVVAGNFHRDEVLKEIDDFYKDKVFDNENVELLDLEEEIIVKNDEGVLIHPTPLEHIELAFKIDISKLSPQERLDLDFSLGCFYNQYFGVTSPIYKKLVDEKVITSGISCGDNIIGNFLVINVGAYTYDIDYFKKTILDSLKTLEYFDEEKFELDKKNAILRIILRDENIINMIMPFVDNIVNFNYPYLDNVSDLERFSYEGFVKYIRDIDFSNYTITIIREKERVSD